MDNETPHAFPNVIMSETQARHTEHAIQEKKNQRTTDVTESMKDNMFELHTIKSAYRKKIKKQKRKTQAKSKSQKKKARQECLDWHVYHARKNYSQTDTETTKNKSEQGQDLTENSKKPKNLSAAKPKTANKTKKQPFENDLRKHAITGKAY